MPENKENTSSNQQRGGDEREVQIEPSETEKPGTGDPGRTPGKAEGKDDESATD